MDIANKKYKIHDNIVEVTAVDESKVEFLTYKVGEQEKHKGECDIRFFTSVEELDQYILND